MVEFLSAAKAGIPRAPNNRDKLRDSRQQTQNNKPQTIHHATSGQTKISAPLNNLLWNHCALARKFCGQRQPLRRLALNFLDFFVLFHQGKRTRKRTRKNIPQNTCIPTAHPSDSPNWGAPAIALTKTIKASNHATSHKKPQTQNACPPKQSPLESLRAGPKILRAAQPVRWVALNFLDFLVLFYQEKRTKKN
jgi:hypothetical protein